MFHNFGGVGGGETGALLQLHKQSTYNIGHLALWDGGGGTNFSQCAAERHLKIKKQKKKDTEGPPLIIALQ